MRTIDWRRFDKLLGTDFDSAIADKIGCSTKAVRDRRRRLNISAFGKQSGNTLGSDAPGYYEADFDKLLGTMPDTKLAKMVGKTRQSIAQRRRVRGIRSYTLQKRMARDDEIRRDHMGRTAERFLKELFEFSNCEECGRGAKGHVAVPIRFGMGQKGDLNWFAKCKGREAKKAKPDFRFPK